MTANNLSQWLDSYFSTTLAPTPSNLASIQAATIAASTPTPYPGTVLAPTVIAPQLCQPADLIPIRHGAVIGDSAVETVNARELHAFLESKQEFATWIKKRIDDFGFVENQDFVCLTNLSSEGRGGHNRREYHITLDMAKELSMVERNEKGKQARQYFIACEKQLKESAQLIKVPTTLKDALKLAWEQQEQIEQQALLMVMHFCMHLYAVLHGQIAEKIRY